MAVADARVGREQTNTHARFEDGQIYRATEDEEGRNVSHD